MLALMSATHKNLGGIEANLALGRVSNYIDSVQNY